MNMSTGATPMNGARGTALHRQIYLVLRDEISRGLFAEGALPNEEALCERFGVSRITVRRALNDLVEDGFVRNRQGVGAFVAIDLGRAGKGADFSFIGDMRRTLKETSSNTTRASSHLVRPTTSITADAPSGVPRPVSESSYSPTIHCGEWALGKSRVWPDRPTLSPHSLVRAV